LSPRHTDSSLTLEIGKVHSFHRRVQEIFKKHTTADNLSIGQRASLGGRDSWKNTQVGKLIELELLPSPWEVGYRRNNTSTPVVRCRTAESFCVSWFERWYVERPQWLRLDTVSLGFWSGPRDSIRQLFRAEWEHCDSVAASGRAQPHWNIDHEIPTAFSQGSSAFTTIASSSDSGLEELSPQDNIALDISRYHLCMSARWAPQHQQVLHQPYGEDASLLSWLDLALEHIGQEFRGRITNASAWNLGSL
jgi:hypothetical protein